MFRPPAAVLAEPAPRALLQIATLSALFRSAFPAPPASPLYLPAPASHTATHCHEPASPSFVKRHSSPPANKPPRQAQERPYRRDHRCAAWHRLTQPPSALVCTRRGALQRGGRAAARGKSRARRRRQGAVHRCSRGRAAGAASALRQPRHLLANLGPLGGPQVVHSAVRLALRQAQQQSSGAGTVKHGTGAGERALAA